MRAVLGWIGIGLLSACTTPSAPPAPKISGGAPYYRVFRGVKRAELGRKAFARKLSAEFIPALPKTHGPEVLRAYLPALPKPAKDGGLPDEVALVAYVSEAKYRAARAEPAGKAYADLHWEVFDRERTKTGGAEPYRGEIAADTAYDVLARDVDWNAGYSTVFLGRRKKDFPPTEFRKWLAGHVAAVRDAFRPRGYVFVATDDGELAFMNWESEAAMQAAFATEAGKAIAADAGRAMETAMFEGAREFTGRAKPGEAYRVRVGTR